MVQLDLVGNLRDLNVLSVGVRLLLAMVFGGTIGFERGIRQRAAGLRTHMLLCVGAASTMLVSQFIYASLWGGGPCPAQRAGDQWHRLFGGRNHYCDPTQPGQGVNYGGNPVGHRLHGIGRWCGVL